jgi:RNA polymerase sigma factor (sigma-70 family)
MVSTPRPSKRIILMTDWDAIVAKHGACVWTILWRLLADHSDVEDCFQETFISAWKVSRSQHVKRWPALLGRLATARAMDRLRNRYRHGGQRHAFQGEDSAGHRLEEAASTDSGPVERAVATELVERLREALAQLPDRQANMFYLYVICGWSQRELSDEMQMTENAVGVTIHRARQRIREMLTESQ